MYNLINNILSLPATNANSTVTQCAVAVVIISVVISLHGLWSFLRAAVRVR